MKFSNKSFIVFLSMLATQGGSFISGHATSNLDLEDPDHTNQIMYEENVEPALMSQKPTVILAYMDHCNHCHALLPFFKQQAKEMTKVRFLTINGPKLHLPKYVALLSKKYGNEEFKIIGFPSIIFVKNGKIIDLQTGGSQKKLQEKLLKYFK